MENMNTEIEKRRTRRKTSGNVGERRQFQCAISGEKCLSCSSSGARNGQAGMSFDAISPRARDAKISLSSDGLRRRSRSR